MIPPGEYATLEGAIASLRRASPEALKAIAKIINSADPRAEFNPETITASKYGESIPGFAITYGQLGAYLNTAVNKYASVLIDTEIGVIESLHVLVNRDWLARLYERAERQPEVIRDIAIRSRASKGATVTPLIPLLEDQDPNAALAELSKLKIRLERNLAIRPDSERDREIERLRALLEISNAEKSAATGEKAALAQMVKILTFENDQLRKVRAPQPAVSDQPATPKSKKHKPTNVETFNEERRAVRSDVAERARQLWKHEDYANHRTMNMVSTIRILAETEPMGILPESDEVLAIWISRDAAPEFAKRPGRPRKEKPKK